MSTPPIVTYGPNPNAPTAMTWAAAMVPDKREGSHWMATGVTEEEARAKLEAMWEKEHPQPTEKQRAAWAKRKAAESQADADEDFDIVI